MKAAVQTKMPERKTVKIRMIGKLLMNKDTESQRQQGRETKVGRWKQDKARENIKL